MLTWAYSGSSQSPSAAALDGTSSSPTIQPSTTATGSTTTGSGAATRTSSAAGVQVTKANCPDGDKQIVNAGFNGDYYLYRIHCNSDFKSDESKDELASVNVPSFDKCLYLCNSMNYLQGRSDVGVTYYATDEWEQDPGACWCLGGTEKKVIDSPGKIVAELEK